MNSKGTVVLLTFMLLALMGNAQEKKFSIAYFSTSAHKSTVTLSGVKIKPTRILQITDSHITIGDGKDEPYYKEYASRMAAAYEKGNHYKTGLPIERPEAFVSILEEAKQQQVDLIVLTGDIINFPSTKATEFVLTKLKECGIPFMYIAGNHDWHLEGMAGSSHDLRETWREKVLHPLYQGENPSHYAKQVNGINVVMIDNATYQITTEQLTFLREQKALGLPMVVGMHIPVSVDGESGGIGSHRWGSATDHGYNTERREKWPESGHTQETYDFVNELYSAPCVIVLSGHIHQDKTDGRGGMLQLTTHACRDGSYRLLEIKSE